MNHEDIKATIHQWFLEYLDTFIRCAKSTAPDLAALQGYYYAPTSMSTDDVFLPVGSQEQVGMIFANQLALLAKTDYGGSEAVDPQIQVFNRRTATMTVTWVRRKRSGDEFWRERVTYWVANTDLGWRIISVAVHSRDA